MKFICTAGNIKKAITGSERLIGKNLTLPILSNILIEANKSGVKISATNLEIGLVSKVRAKVEKEGKFTIPAKIIGNFLSQLNDDDQIDISTESNGLRISGAGNNVLIRGIDAKDFPIIPKPKDEAVLELSPSEFSNELLKVIVCASPQDNRQQLTGVFVQFSKNELAFAATDSFRLSEVKIPLEKSMIKSHYEPYISKNKAVIIPARTISEVVRSINPDSVGVKIYTGENQIFFEINGIFLVSRLIDGSYPEYQQILPQGYKYSAIVGREELIKAVRLASVFSDAKSREIRIIFEEKKEKINIETQSIDTGESRTQVNAKVEVEGRVEIAMNNKFVQDVLVSFISEKINISFNDNMGPVAFREEKIDGGAVENFIHVIMPIKS